MASNRADGAVSKTYKLSEADPKHRSVHNIAHHKINTAKSISIKKLV